MANWRQKGSMTVEAAIVLPLFISVILTIAFFMKFVYTHELIQHAITETANEMAAYGYLYHVSGIQGIHDTIRDEIKEKSRLTTERINSIIESYTSLRQLPEEAAELIRQGKYSIEQMDLENVAGEIDQGMDLVDYAKSNFENLIENSREIAENPLGEFQSIACMIASGAFEDIKTELFTPLVRFYAKKYLVTDEEGDADKILKHLNIEGGINGLDFSKSSFFENDSNEIDIVVRYKIKIPLPINILPKFYMVQRATVKAWLDGDAEYKYEEVQADENEDIWSMGNFQRGRRIREIFGGNLPQSYPVIASFDSSSGRAVMIKSMDLTAKAYKSSIAVIEKIEEYIDKLHSFSGNDEPWGREKVVIKQSQIKSRQLLLVIPKNSLSQEIEKALEEAVSRAALKGIELKIQRYGIKKGQE